jgi:hypothetical protein
MSIRSLVEQPRQSPVAHSVALPLINSYLTLALKLFRKEPAIAGLDWNFSSTHKSSPRVERRVGAGLLSMLLEIHPAHV